MTHKAAKAPLFFYTTAPLPCPYLPDRIERKIVTELGGPHAEQVHDRLSHSGFRRSHAIAYRPVCPGCDACVPVRIVVDGFRASKSFRRVVGANEGLVGREVQARSSAEQYRLFARYQRSRHAASDMATMTFYDYRAMVEESPIDTRLAEFRDTDGTLVGVCLLDRLSDGLSAVYSFYEPGLERRSLGSFMVLWLIDEARAARLSYVYLGYWIADCEKMAYKARFRPIEALGPGGWRPLHPA